MKTIKYEVTYEDGREEWLVNGKPHREDGPAIKYADGSEEWYKNGMCHREDGPAAKNANGDEYWYQNGEFHREDGPAVKLVSGKVEYWIEGSQLTKEQFESRTKKNIEKMIRQLSSLIENKLVDIEEIKYKLTKM